MYNLKKRYGEWALVTGASSGIGEQFARTLASEQVNLILVARRIDRLNSLAESLQNENNIRVITIQADLTKDDFLEVIKEKTSGFDVGILINNAGAGNFTTFNDSDIDQELLLLRLNCSAPVILARHFIKEMVQRKQGAIIFVGSIVGSIPNPGMALYSASKAFSNILGSALWYDQKKNNVDILTVAPGGTKTEFHRKAHIKEGPLIISPVHVVNTAFRALGKKPFVVDGLINKIMYIIGRVLPFHLVMFSAGLFSEKRKKV